MPCSSWDRAPHVLATHHDHQHHELVNLWPHYPQPPSWDLLRACVCHQGKGPLAKEMRGRSGGATAAAVLEWELGGARSSEMRWQRRGEERRGEKNEGGVAFALGLKLGLRVNLSQIGGLFCKVARRHRQCGRRRALSCQEEAPSSL
jgi:hypothetical protein